MPDDLRVVFTVTAPIREPAKTVADIIRLVQAMLQLGMDMPERDVAIHGNRVRVRVVEGATETAKVAGIVHNPGPPAATLLDLAQSLADAQSHPA